MRKAVFYTLLGDLERQIGSLSPGTILPAEQLLADKYAISKPTLRRALAVLASNGLIVKKNGIGNIVLNSRNVMRREIIFLCHNIRFYSAMLSAFGAEVQKKNYFFSIVPLEGDAFVQTQILEAAVERAPAGLAVILDQGLGSLPIYRELAEGGIPLLFLNHLPAECRNVSRIAIDNKKAFARIVRYLYREGCRKFALYGNGSDFAAAAAERVAGYYEGMRACRLRPRKRLQCLVPEQTEEFLDQFRSPGTVPDAVCCLNDCCAMELIDRLSRAEIDFKNIRFSGFDNLEMAKYFPHRILTARLPLRELGVSGADLLMRQIENRNFKPVSRMLPVEILEESGWVGKQPCHKMTNTRRKRRQ